MNTSEKGASLERLAKKDLEGEGYLVHRTIRTPIIIRKTKSGFQYGSHNNDIFGVFDLVAMRRGDGVLQEASLRFIQVTTIGELPKRMRKVDTVREYAPGCADFEVWGRVGGAKKLDKRYKERRFVRRQYWRKMRFHGEDWLDITREEDGLGDAGAEAVRVKSKSSKRVGAIKGR